MAIDYDTAGDYQSFAHNAVLDLGSGPATFACWIQRPNTADGLVFFHKYIATSPYSGFSFHLDTNAADKLNLWTGDASGGWASSTGTITDTNWHHVGATVSGTTVTFYIDGSSSGTATRTPDMSAGSGRDLFFARNVSDAVNTIPRMAEAAIWNRALTAAEFASLAVGYSPAFFPTPVFYADLIRVVFNRMLFQTVTTTGTPTVMVHPRVIYPSGGYGGLASGGAPPVDDQPRQDYARYPYPFVTGVAAYG